MNLRLLAFVLLFPVVIIAQVTDSTLLKKDTSGLYDTVRIPAGETAEVVEHIPGHNMYGDLLNDDPAYNKRYPLWIPAVRVVATDAFNWALARYFFNYEWARVNTEVWKNNLKNGWEWDNDRFGVNFIGHPHSGNYYFNVARSNGYNFWQSVPFAVGGSLLWEYFGENTPPSTNDIINTPISGAFLGEVLYRISSNILDDRARGGNRVFREILAGIVNPPRALNRLTQGKMFRVTSREVYQKEPLNITFSAGLHKVNDGNKFGSGSTNVIANLQFDYGDPFEVRHRKPFDVFRLRLESRYGDDKKLIDNVLGYGVLFSKNITTDNYGMLLGIFQHFDYWNNKIFELGSLGFGPGLLWRINLGQNSKLYSGAHVAVVPLGASNTRFGPDTSAYRDYNFGGGWQARIEETLNLGNRLSLGISGYYYWLSNYESPSGKSHVGIIKPRIQFRLFGNTSLGMEHHVYYNDRSINKIPGLHLTQTEQKFFVQYFFEDRRRSKKYQ